MASRQEEKEARRQARLEQEAAERKSASRNKRMQLLFGGVLGVGILVAVVLLFLVGGSDGGSEDTNVKEAVSTGTKLPAVAITDEKEAAAAAGCTLSNPADEGRGHEEKTFKASDYKTNPPTSGTHFPTWAQDGIYEPGKEPQLGELVHTLEHGRIDVQYKPGTPNATVDKLEEFLAESDSGYHMLLFQNTTNMDAQVAATAWDHSLSCPEMNDKVFDALRTFRRAHIDRGPEKVA